MALGQFDNQLVYNMTEVARRDLGVGPGGVRNVAVWASYKFSKDEVADHCEIHSCWIIVCDKVYDVTNFTREHPGGLDVIMEYGGRDATVAFMDKGHSNDAWIVLSDYYIGELVKRISQHTARDFPKRHQATWTDTRGEFNRASARERSPKFPIPATQILASDRERSLC
uniref:Cytochrome b5 n=1 Tax=Magallana gigas TaxID=29159 RepID=K1R8G5_MAGGI